MMENDIQTLKNIKTGSLTVLDEVLSIYNESILEKSKKRHIKADRQNLHRLSNKLFIGPEEADRYEVCPQEVWSQ